MLIRQRFLGSCSLELGCSAPRRWAGKKEGIHMFFFLFPMLDSAAEMHHSSSSGSGPELRITDSSATLRTRSG